MDDTTKKSAPITKSVVDESTVNDLLFEQAKILADTASLKKEQLEETKQSLAELREKYSKPISDKPEVSGVVVQPSQNQNPQAVVPPMPTMINSMEDVTPKTPSATQPAAFPNAPVGTPTF